MLPERRSPSPTLGNVTIPKILPIRDDVSIFIRPVFGSLILNP
ncbi:protein of unknown function [Xenorhabdus poinarii G6]|uniref:Uncharacterized protein n=1 Tax=Xenorhabdus poinarii G6 TaxID=1354304 RepID=A0A068QYZ0_9GAMM|nr:protein of unknown function [Xenorhabdus poinarii G6]